MIIEEKIDIIDLIINILRDHEKTFNGLLYRLEDHLDKIGVIEPELHGVTYIQAMNTVDVLASTLPESRLPESMKRVIIQDFVHSLNHRRMVSNRWTETLIKFGAERLTWALAAAMLIASTVILHGHTPPPDERPRTMICPSKGTPEDGAGETMDMRRNATPAELEILKTIDEMGES